MVPPRESPIFPTPNMVTHMQKHRDRGCLGLGKWNWRADQGASGSGDVLHAGVEPPPHTLEPTFIVKQALYAANGSEQRFLK